jgi:hypothetical protein
MDNGCSSIFTEGKGEIFIGKKSHTKRFVEGGNKNLFE